MSVNLDSESSIEGVVSNPIQELPGEFIASTPQQRRCVVISLIRHAQCHSNINGRKESIEDDGPDPLTENGRFQAETLGKNWADTRIDLLVSSPLTRAHDTAKALSDHNKGHPKIVTLHELVERKYGRKVLRLMRGDYGAARFELTGKTPHGSGPLSRFHTPAEGGESLDDVAQRAERIIRLILSKGVDLSEAPEFFLNKKTTDTPSVLPDGIPHVVIVSHNVFLGELYDKLKYWGGNYRMTACDYRNAAWSRHILWYEEGTDKMDVFDMKFCQNGW